MKTWDICELFAMNMSTLLHKFAMISLLPNYTPLTKSYVNLFWILLTTSELALVDRRNKREIRHLEQELPKWQVLVDSVTGWYFFCCSESKDLFFTPFSGITCLGLSQSHLSGSPSSDGRPHTPHLSLPWQAFSCQCLWSSVFLLKSILSVNVLVPFCLFKTSCLQYC